MAEYIEREAVKALFDERYETAFVQERTRENKEHWRGVCAGLNWGRNTIADAPTADVVPKREVEEIFEKLKRRECSNSVCAWCVHATDYGRRNEECDKPYIDKNGKEQKACYVYAKFESLIDKELAELKKKYTEGNQNVNGN